ncbi:MAG: oxalate decarboxylase, partial [Hyphomicrobiales bacterium]|nr:oxalate decarboxylase [Hyphomicrobiales bacterium]
MNISRRSLINASVAGITLAASQAQAQNALNPMRDPRHGGTDPGPHDPIRDRENPDILNPPSTDSGTLPNLRFAFSDSHVRQGTGGWTRQVTVRELGVSEDIAGVNMRLNAGGIRELHWHKEAEWSYMIYGRARITAINPQGQNFVDEVGAGDLWYFPSGIPHSIQGLGPDGCEFLLIFDNGHFDEDSTFLISDWFKHVPKPVLAKNFGVGIDQFNDLPNPEDYYIFAAPVPAALGSDPLMGAAPANPTFSHKLQAQTPDWTGSGGSVRISDSKTFPASLTIAAALVEVLPGRMRELHWHPNAAEWQYYLQGEARMGVFAGSGQARTFDYRAGDVGFVPFAMGHYIENTGDQPLRFLEIF